ncbi:MAG: serine protease [Candidatus Syntrophoarchaeum caldarius]|uniref:Serine protease n=1 Tax=Candidatus Syntropharchaeum caldarium TaxID=1838285 RepID=A0A1F2PD20_9EURY|nr:MAG: serine protease [Candidatus Syntrophoarchaeum caldarius]
MRWQIVLILTLIMVQMCGVAGGTERFVYVVDLKGTVTGGSALDIEDAIAHAKEIGAEAVIIRIDTPGGLLFATKEIIKSIDNADVPVITFVSPKGAMAASAGSFILITGHVAAMSPGTATGAATPVSIGPIGGGADIANKTKNYFAADMRSIAEERGRNATIAEQFVTEALSLTANEALDAGIIDLIADGTDELLEAVDGRKVIVNGREITLQTAGADIMVHERPFRVEIVDLIGRPEIAFILFLIGIYGLIFGFSSPGTYVPEMIGAISLLLGLYGMGLFNINLFGVLLLLLGIVLFIAEALTPTYGILTVGGGVCMILGALMIPQEPLLGSDWLKSFGAVVVVMTVVSLLFFVFGIGAVIKTRKRKVATGAEEMIGLVTRALSDIDERGGSVKVHGEIWRAKSVGGLIAEDEEVEIVDLEGLTLLVRRKD